MNEDEHRVKVRRRWNDSEASELPIEVLWDFHYRNEAGGVCRAMPRAFLCAHVWCDHVSEGAFGHRCPDPPPHDLVVCILRNDNISAVYEDLLLKARR
jgi:hypothetical protein